MELCCVAIVSKESLKEHTMHNCFTLLGQKIVQRRNFKGTTWLEVLQSLYGYSFHHKEHTYPTLRKCFTFPMFPQNSLSFNALSKWSSVPLLGGGQCTDMCCSPHATARMRRWASCASLKWLSGTLYLVTLPESPSTAGHHKTSVFDGLYTCQTSPRQITLKDITVKEMLFQTALSNPSRR